MKRRTLGALHGSAVELGSCGSSAYFRAMDQVESTATSTPGVQASRKGTSERQTTGMLPPGTVRNNVCRVTRLSEQQR